MSYSLTAAGVRTLDTLLLPTPPGARTRASLSVEASDDGGRTLRLISSTSRLDGYYFRAPGDGASRRLGPYLFDGSLAYVDRHAAVQRILLAGGTLLRQGRRTLLATAEPLVSTLAVRLDPARRTIEIAGPAAKPGGRPLHLAAPWARTATVAGQKVPITRKGGLVTISALH
ncbi:hypothetical protein ACFQ0B_55425 [Nonomuraea thailandensis]